MTGFWTTFLSNLLDTSWFEFVAVVLGIGSVWYARRENILVYPTGIISVVIYVFICFNARLYADSGINFFYFIMSVYGWFNWTHKDKNEEVLHISMNSRSQQISGIAITFVSYWIIIGMIWIFNHEDRIYMQSWVPWVDAFTTAIFLVGMLLMARKKVENWVYWIIGDIVSLPMYFMKGLIFTSFQYLVFLILAILGLVEWRRRWKAQQVAL
jgi:nicotinamide mononucleotide transporter